MRRFGLGTPADLLQNLRQEKADFLRTKCLESRHAINAAMMAHHLVEWVWSEIKRRPDCPYEDQKAFLRHLRAIHNAPIDDAGSIAKGIKRFERDEIAAAERNAAFRRGNCFQSNGSTARHLWVRRKDGREQKVEEFIDELIRFWDRVFRNNAVIQYSDELEPVGFQYCPCGAELVVGNYRGESLIGCKRCNVWWPVAKPPIRLSGKDLRALLSTSKSR